MKFGRGLRHPKTSFRVLNFRKGRNHSDFRKRKIRPDTWDGAILLWKYPTTRKKKDRNWIWAEVQTWANHFKHGRNQKQFLGFGGKVPQSS